MKTKAAPKPQRQPTATPDCFNFRNPGVGSGRAVSGVVRCSGQVGQVHILCRGSEGRVGRRPAARCWRGCRALAGLIRKMEACGFDLLRAAWGLPDS